eukprot:TRINITY_DN10570_c0_g1_i1.p1 TRINITY_DN10570_c0_g1~~TRINITY_DN10570_c0_g1_i1.p1  ORF type:complete len:166 (-),score=18.84 TRINITY_DN10570_c0_g1_i1:523-1020(-)
MSKHPRVGSPISCEQLHSTSMLSSGGWYLKKEEDMIVDGIGGVMGIPYKKEESRDDEKFVTDPLSSNNKREQHDNKFLYEGCPNKARTLNRVLRLKNVNERPWIAKQKAEMNKYMYFSPSEDDVVLEAQLAGGSKMGGDIKLLTGKNPLQVKNRFYFKLREEFPG